MAYQLDDGSQSVATVTGALQVAGSLTANGLAIEGETPPTEATIGAAVVTTAAATSSYGYTEAQANAIVARLNEVRAATVAIQDVLIAAGLIAAA